jgi:NADPH-dependent glutamate synthase beta subunit-like oxidoreductase
MHSDTFLCARGRLPFDPEIQAKLLKERGQTHGTPPFVRHALRGSIGGDEPRVSPGVFAAGDVRSGSAKRVAAAVGEGSMVVQFVHEVLETL